MMRSLIRGGWGGGGEKCSHGEGVAGCACTQISNYIPVAVVVLVSFQT